MLQYSYKSAQKCVISTFRILHYTIKSLIYMYIVGLMRYEHLLLKYRFFENAMTSWHVYMFTCSYLWTRNMHNNHVCISLYYISTVFSVIIDNIMRYKQFWKYWRHQWRHNSGTVYRMKLQVGSKDAEWPLSY